MVKKNIENMKEKGEGFNKFIKEIFNKKSHCLILNYLIK